MVARSLCRLIKERFPTIDLLGIARTNSPFGSFEMPSALLLVRLLGYSEMLCRDEIFACRLPRRVLAHTYCPAR